jgi:hypothetical protein
MEKHPTLLVPHLPTMEFQRHLPQAMEFRNHHLPAMEFQKHHPTAMGFQKHHPPAMEFLKHPLLLELHRLQVEVVSKTIEDIHIWLGEDQHLNLLVQELHNMDHRMAEVDHHLLLEVVF